MSKIQPVCKRCLKDLEVPTSDNLCGKCRHELTYLNSNRVDTLGNNYKIQPRPELRGN